MHRLYSRVALISASAYAALIATGLIAMLRVNDAEGRLFDFFFIELPWGLVLGSESRFVYALALTLNILTLYSLVLAVVRLFKSE